MKWTKIKQDDFEEIKQILGCGTLLTYPYFNEEFKIHTNASDFRLGAFFSQNGKLIVFFGLKKWCPDELLSNIKGTVKHC